MKSVKSESIIWIPQNESKRRMLNCKIKIMALGSSIQYDYLKFVSYTWLNNRESKMSKTKQCCNTDNSNFKTKTTKLKKQVKTLVSSCSFSTILAASWDRASSRSLVYFSWISRLSSTVDFSSFWRAAYSSCSLLQMQRKIFNLWLFMSRKHNISKESYSCFDSYTLK